MTSCDSQVFSLESSQTLPFAPTDAPPPRRVPKAGPAPLGAYKGKVEGLAGPAGGAVGTSGSPRLVTLETTVQSYREESSEVGASDKNWHFLPDVDSENLTDFEDTLPSKKRQNRWSGLKQNFDGFSYANDLQREAVEGCGTVYDVWKHEPCGALVGVLWRCKNRWCRECFKAWAVTAMHDLYTLINGWQSVKHLVLSIRSVGLGELREGWRLLDNSFRNLRRSKIWKGHVTTYVQARGLTFSHGRWHVHLHIALEGDYLPHLELKAAWVKASGGAGGPSGVQINEARNRIGLARELIKGTKGDFKVLLEKLHGKAVLWGELVLGCRGLRWFSPGGKLRRPKQEKSPCYCPRCGGEFSRGQWSSVRYTAEEYASATVGPLWHDLFDGFARGAPLEMGD